MKTCKHPTCENVCRRAEKARKAPQRIKPVADKRAAINRQQYSPKAKAFREANPRCKVNSPVCTKWTQGVHHLKGKNTIELLLDARYWKPACNACNGYVERYPAWAFATGNKLSKY